MLHNLWLKLVHQSLKKQPWSRVVFDFKTRNPVTCHWYLMLWTEQKIFFNFDALRYLVSRFSTWEQLAWSTKGSKIKTQLHDEDKEKNSSNIVPPLESWQCENGKQCSWYWPILILKLPFVQKRHLSLHLVVIFHYGRVLLLIRDEVESLGLFSFIWFFQSAKVLEIAFIIDVLR